MAQIKVIQHNVRKWSTNKHSLCQAYQNKNPEIILINSHGEMNSETIKIFNYNIHQINTTNEIHNAQSEIYRRGNVENGWKPLIMVDHAWKCQ